MILRAQRDYSQNQYYWKTSARTAVEPEKVITGRAMGSMLGLGACVAVAAWAGGDRDDGPAGPPGIIDEG